jgi:hypothetical protein
VCYHSFQLCYPHAEYWLKEIWTNVPPDLGQLALHVVLVCDYLIFHLLFCICEEPENKQDGELSSLTFRRSRILNFGRIITHRVIYVHK